MSKDPVSADERPLVAHVITGTDRGGAEGALQRLVLAGRARGAYDHAVISLRHVGEVGEELLAAGVSVTAAGLYGSSDSWRAFGATTAQLRAWRPVIVQTWMPHADLIGSLAALAAGQRRLVWGIRTTNVARGRGNRARPLTRLLAKLSHRLPDRIVCCADAAMETHAAIGYDRDRMVVIPNGYEQTTSPAPTVDALRREWHIDAGHPVVGRIGRYHPHKGLGDFLAVAAVVSTARPDIQFVMCGEGLTMANTRLRDDLARAGLDGRVRLLGMRRDMDAVYAACDVTVSTSTTEGFPNVVAEAMAAGCAVVGTDVGDTGRIVHGLFPTVPPGAPHALAIAVLDTLDDLARRGGALRDEARSRIEEEFGLPRMLAAYEAVYDEVLRCAE